MSEITDIAAARVSIFEDSNFQPRELLLRGSENVENMDNAVDTDGKKGFGGKASSAQWHIPRGWALMLYEDDHYRGQAYPLIGHGIPQQAQELSGFEDDCSSARWEQPGDVFVYTGFTAEQERRMREAHRRIYATLFECSHLSLGERSDLIRAYWKRINFGVTADEGILGKARVGGSKVWIHVQETLDPANDDLLDSVLAHEMMHIAGHDHPKWESNKEAPPGYYESAPEQAMRCLAAEEGLRLNEAWQKRACRLQPDGTHALENGAH